MRGVYVDHDTIQRWVYKFPPFIELQMKKRKLRVGTSWRMDETYIKVKGFWCFLYRAVDKSCNTFDFLLTRRRQRMIMWRIQNGLGFKNFESAKRTINGIKIVHMLRKNQMINPGITMFKSFCKLVA